MADTLLGIFEDASEAEAAVVALRRDGFKAEQIELISAEPLLIEAATPIGRRSLIGWFAVAGGLIGASAALLLTIVTSQSTGLITGGMPIVAPWAFGIVVFELTALGAILAALGRTIYEARLVRRRVKHTYDDNAIYDGKIVLLVGVAGTEQRSAAEKILGPHLEAPGSQ